MLSGMAGEDRRTRPGAAQPLADTLRPRAAPRARRCRAAHVGVSLPRAPGERQQHAAFAQVAGGQKPLLYTRVLSPSAN
eukprot:scaffold1130_cov161-Prasinococcus_capsulatus_cf.AAC.1